ncbi:MAG TPA: 2Fe-2S iron-sulfur cluster-binding protein [Stellaceae bacterium]|nr:2Fe-2S iron-sulfur cluster-binding protein [Stellaceae bacterium]
MKPLSLTINGIAVDAAVEPRTHLADFLREARHLTGTHIGCEHGVCGACTILIDGAPARSCITYAVACAGAGIVTIEGLDDDDIAGELRAAFSREHALQCGYCTPGVLIAARDLVLRAETADEREIRIAMSGNLCRCTGYVGIVRAIQSVIAGRRARGIAPVPGAGRVALGPIGSDRLAATEPAANAPERGRGTVRAQTAAAAPSVTRDELADAAPQSTFEANLVVHRPLDEVWRFFGQVGEVAGCLPGVSLVGEPSETSASGMLRIKIGPIAAEFAGTAEIERDPADHSGTIRGNARDRRSNSATRGVIRYRLRRAEEGATRIDLSVGYTLTGTLAQFSRSDLVQDIGRRLVRAFGENLEARLAAPDRPVMAAAELNAGALLISVLLARLRRWLASWRGR